MYYSHMANVNVGIITTLWSIQPLAAALLDYFINNEKLTVYHLIGIIMVIASGLFISFSKVADPDFDSLGHPFSRYTLSQINEMKD